jgi:hypothetical protein
MFRLRFKTIIDRLQPTLPIGPNDNFSNLTKILKGSMRIGFSNNNSNNLILLLSLRPVPRLKLIVPPVLWVSQVSLTSSFTKQSLS